MRDTLGGRPYEVTSRGGTHNFRFYPIAKGAKNPDAVIFRLSLSGEDLKKLAKMAA